MRELRKLQPLSAIWLRKASRLRAGARHGLDNLNERKEWEWFLSFVTAAQETGETILRGMAAVYRPPCRFLDISKEARTRRLRGRIK